MEKMQLLEPAEGAKAIPVFQRLRRLTMRLNPTNEDEPKPTLNIDEDESRPFKKARTLSAMPIDESLKETEIRVSCGVVSDGAAQPVANF